MTFNNLFTELAQEVFRDSLTVSKLDPSVKGKVITIEHLAEIFINQHYWG